jgi:hypothetical protein
LNITTLVDTSLLVRAKIVPELMLWIGALWNAFLILNRPFFGISTDTLVTGNTETRLGVTISSDDASMISSEFNWSGRWTSIDALLFRSSPPHWSHTSTLESSDIWFHILGTALLIINTSVRIDHAERCSFWAELARLGVYVPMRFGSWAFATIAFSVFSHTN